MPVSEMNEKYKLKMLLAMLEFLDDIGHRECLSRAGHAEKCHRIRTLVQCGADSLDCRRLVACRLVCGVDLEFHCPFSKLFPMSESLQITQRYAICKKLSSLIPFMSCSSPTNDSSRRSGLVGIIVPEILWTSLIIVYFCFRLKGSAIFLCRLFNCET